VAGTDIFFHMVQKRMIEKSGDYYIIPDEQLKMGEVLFFNRQHQPGTLYIYSMSLCPHSNKAILWLIDYIRQNNSPVDIKVRYIVESNEFGVSSLHGVDEIREDLIQIMVQKYYKDKFLDYITARQDKGFTDALSDIGITADEIGRKKDIVLALLKEESKDIFSLGITHSPMFLWENRLLIPRLDILIKYEPFNAKKDL
jgi:hypothetical protein